MSNYDQPDDISVETPVDENETTTPKKKRYAKEPRNWVYETYGDSTSKNPYYEDSPALKERIAKLQKEQERRRGKIKWVFLIIIGLIFVGIAAGIAYSLQSEERIDSDDRNSTENGDGNADITTIQDQTNDGDDNNSTNGETEIIVTKDGIEYVEKVIEDFEAEIKGPDAKENADDMEYTYYLVVNQSAVNEYKEFTYEIINSKCGVQGAILDGSFRGTIKEPPVGTSEFIIKIDENYLETKDIYMQTDYLIKDIRGKVITTGKVDVPQCIGQKGEGSFEIQGPVIDYDEKDEMYEFEWTILLDEIALSELQSGFTYNIENNCFFWIQGADAFQRKWNTGIGNKMKFAVRILKEGFEMGENLLTDSTYVITNTKGDDLYEGKVQVPNCK